MAEHSLFAAQLASPEQEKMGKGVMLSNKKVAVLKGLLGKIDL